MDDARFEAAWSAHGSAVLRYCTYSMGSRNEGEDVAAETFARFLAKGDKVPTEHTEAWLIRVARNLCASQHRANRRRTLMEARATATALQAEPGLRPSSWEYARKLREVERLVLYLRIAEEYPFSHVARIIGKSESATKMTFYRAIDRLRAEIEKDAGHDSNFVGGADCV